MDRFHSMHSSHFAIPQINTRSSMTSNSRQSSNSPSKRSNVLNVRNDWKTLEQYYPNKKQGTYGGKYLYVPDTLPPRNHPRIEFENKKQNGVLTQDKNIRFKTEICRNFKERGSCIYGDQCQFAHGRQELRDAIKGNKYKTKSCQKYWIAGYCAYGPRCNFLHLEADESFNDKSSNCLELFSIEEDSEETDNNEVDLADTVQEVILSGRGILDQMERDKIACDPKLEDLLLKLTRALPPKARSVQESDMQSIPKKSMMKKYLLTNQTKM